MKLEVTKSFTRAVILNGCHVQLIVIAPQVREQSWHWV